MQLREYIMHFNMTHKQFGDKVGASTSTVRKWIYGQRFPREEHLKKIMYATDGLVKPNDFLKKEF